jgi:hypothetical protein
MGSQRRVALRGIRNQIRRFVDDQWQYRDMTGDEIDDEWQAWQW